MNTYEKRSRENKLADSIFILLFSSLSFAATVPGGPSTSGNTNINSMLSYEDVVKELNSIEQTSKGKVEVFTLDRFGKSEQGRSIYAAKVGAGKRKSGFRLKSMEMKNWLQRQHFSC